MFKVILIQLALMGLSLVQLLRGRILKALSYKNIVVYF